jgi:GntR family transcriptional regulator
MRPGWLFSHEIQGWRPKIKTVLPSYFQIRQTIRGWIYDKDYNPGDRFPSEKELVEKFKVNRLTVRQAISHLVQEGFLEIRRGEGTFVTQNVGLTSRLSLESTGFLEDLNQMSKFKTKLLRTKTVRATEIIKKKLELEGDREAVEIKRVRSLKNNIPWYTVCYLPLEIGTKILARKKDLRKASLTQIMERDLGIEIIEAFQVVRASFADAEAADNLNIAPGSPLLAIERVWYTKNKRPVEWVRSMYVADTCQYVVRLKRLKGNRRKDE